MLQGHKPQGKTSFGGTMQRICGVGGRPSTANNLAGGFQQINLNQTDDREI